MSVCVPEAGTCEAGRVLFCACPCSNCEAHGFPCPGCADCLQLDIAKDGHAHQWARAVSPGYEVCTVKDCGLGKITRATPAGTASRKEALAPSL